jgi:peptidyl-prolyl cis-trans isomerase SurA
VTRTRLIALASASLLLLTGCGSVDLHPGVAAQVGDDTISMSQVDDVTRSYCSAAESQLQAGQVLAQRYLRGQVAGALALRAAVDQFADEQDVTPTEDYQKAVDQAKASPTLAGLPADQAQALIDVQGIPIYVQAVEKAVGEKQGAADDAATKAGQEAFLGWLDDQDIELDPRLGVSIEKGTTTGADTSLSYALGETATKADADDPDTTYAATLPDSQRCG